MPFSPPVIQEVIQPIELACALLKSLYLHKNHSVERQQVLRLHCISFYLGRNKPNCFRFEQLKVLHGLLRLHIYLKGLCSTRQRQVTFCH